MSERKTVARLSARAILDTGRRAPARGQAHAVCAATVQLAWRGSRWCPRAVAGWAGVGPPRGGPPPRAARWFTEHHDVANAVRRAATGVVALNGHGAHRRRRRGRFAHAARRPRARSASPTRPRPWPPPRGSLAPRGRAEAVQSMGGARRAGAGGRAQASGCFQRARRQRAWLAARWWRHRAIGRPSSVA